MKIKTQNLTGEALDWAVAKCEGNLITFDEHGFPSGSWELYSTNWARGGPIIEREHTEINYMQQEDCPPYWTAHAVDRINMCLVGSWAATPLIAAMRCYVASKLGDEVEVPDELFRHREG